MRMQGKFIGAAALAALVVSGSAGAAVVDFENLEEGDVVTDQYAPTLIISADNNELQGPNITRVFEADQDEEGQPSDDLRPFYEGGNLAAAANASQGTPAAFPGNVLVLARDEESLPPDVSRKGTISFSFDQELVAFGFDIIDADTPDPFSLEFFSGSELVETVPFSAFLDPSSEYFDPSIDFGNRTINRIAPITSAEVGSTFDTVVFRIDEPRDRAAVDAINFTVVPEPGTGAIAAVALAGLHLATGRRRRSRQ